MELTKRVSQPDRILDLLSVDKFPVKLLYFLIFPGNDYDAYRMELTKRADTLKEEALTVCAKISDIRRHDTQQLTAACHLGQIS